MSGERHQALAAFTAGAKATAAAAAPAGRVPVRPPAGAVPPEIMAHQ